MKLILKLYSLFKFPLPLKFDDKLHLSEFKVAVRYFSLRYGVDLTLSDVISSSLTISSIFSAITLLALNRLPYLNFSSSLLISLSVFISLYFYLSTYLIRRYRYERSLYAKYSFFVLEELYLALISTGSLMDAISFICDGCFPRISEDFKFIFSQCFNGLSPERLIEKYARLQPSTSLREGLIAMASSPISVSNRFIRVHSDFSSSEIRRYFRDFLVRLELYCLFIIILGLIFPISLIFLSSFFVTSLELLIFVLVPFQLFLLVFLSHLLMRESVLPLG